MENYNRALTIKNYFNEITSGKLEFSDLRQKLENLGIEQEEITVVIRQVDKKVQRNIEMKAINETGKNLFYGGLIVALFGSVLTIGTLTGLINLKGIGILAYGPIAGGLITAMTGKSQMNRSQTKSHPLLTHILIRLMDLVILDNPRTRTKLVGLKRRV